MASKLGYAASSYIRFHIQNTYGDNEYLKKSYINRKSASNPTNSRHRDMSLVFIAIQLIARMKE